MIGNPKGLGYIQPLFLRSGSLNSDQSDLYLRLTKYPAGELYEPT